MKNSRLASWKTALPFLLPSLAGFVVFSIIPMIMQIFVSLTSWDGLSELTLFSDFSGFMDRFYVGIENYKEILTSKEFYQVIGNTLEFVILYIPLMLIASMIVALILNSHVKGVGIFRVLYYIPVITSWVAGALIWKWVLSPEYGAINNILALFGIEGPSWLQSSKWAMPAIVLASIWKDMGYFGLMLMSGLQGINQEYYDAAAIDGAGKIKQFTRITLPLLTPSAALSGILFWGFDLAGFAGPLPTLDLYRRATMLACFTPIMQWHSEPGGGQFKELMPGGEGNNERSPWNMAAVYNSPEFVTEMRFWHWLRMNLQPYLIATAFRCAAEKVPMMRPLVYEWPQDKAARQVEDEFLLGDAILVAPLLEENQTAREVYLPEGEWYVFFTGKCYHGYQTISTTADMKFPVFIRGGYAVPLHADGMDSLGNPVSQNLNSKLILLVAGAAGKSTFTTNKSVLTCEWKNEKVRVEGTGAETVQIHHFC